MPTYKNQFARPKYYDHEILDEDAKKIGTLRVKPGNILWKPKGQQKFYSVSLDNFREWIKDPKTNANKTGS